jgi:formylglycine-generating enzyme required for sulfatase activity
MIDESVRKIAELIRPQRKKQLSPVAISAAIVFTLAVVAGGVWIALSGPNPPVVTPTLTDVTPLHTPTDTPVAEPSPTASATLTATPTSTATLSLTQVEQTIQAEMNVIVLDNIRTAEAAETATAEQARQYARGTAAALTLTATHLPPTPTIDSRATAEARVTLTQAAAKTTATANAFSTATAYARQTQQAATRTQAWIDSWTPSPTITLTPSFTPTPDVAQIALTPQTANADWSPIERDFDGVMMVLVPSGCFTMGSNSGDDNEQPAHRRCFAEPFWIDKFEVRQAQFAIFSGIQANPSAFTGINLPVESITWYEARDFCELRGGSLPSELEWEYAARGPNSLAYPWGNQFVADNVIYGNNSDSQTRFVSTRPNGVSWVGAFHMSGNVWEWTRTAYRNYPYSKTDGRDNTNSAAYRVVRGGSWNSSAAYVRAAYRSELSQNYFNRTVGFRCMRPVD